MKLIFGIDPGLHGAVAVMVNGELREVHDMPIQPKTGKGGNQLNAHELHTLLLDNYLATTEPSEKEDFRCEVWIERVGAMPGQGVTSMFSFGEGCGVVRGVAAALGLPLHFIAPVKWKGLVGLKGFDKSYALTRAVQLVPTSSSYLTKRSHVGRADAVLIAYCGNSGGKNDKQE